MISRKIKTSSESSFPAGFTAWNYLRGTGTQYIITDLIITNDMKIEIKVDNTRVGGPAPDSDYIGNTTAPANLFGSDRYGLFVYKRGNVKSEISMFKGLLTIEMNPVENGKSEGYINGVKQFTVNNPSTSANNNFMRIFCSVWQNAPDSISKIDVYYVKIWQNGELIRNYVPAVRKSDGKAGLLDTVYKKFFGNNGSGQFEVG